MRDISNGIREQDLVLLKRVGLLAQPHSHLRQLAMQNG